MPHCETCSQHVSRRFQRVFGDPDGDVYACPNCSANAGIGAVTRDRQRERETDS